MLFDSNKRFFQTSRLVVRGNSQILVKALRSKDFKNPIITKWNLKKYSLKS